MSAFDTIQRAFVRAFGDPVAEGWKSLPLPYVPAGQYQSYNFNRYDFERYTNVATGNNWTGEAGTVNAAVMTCIAKLCLAYPAAPLQILKSGTDKPVKGDPLQPLLERPNPSMSYPDLAALTMLYRAFGGNAYWLIQRAKDGTPLEIWPFHDGHITPIPTEKEWIGYFRFTYPDGTTKDIDPADVVHFKWPVPDISQPWRGAAPLGMVAREYEVDNEVSRVIWSSLKNDAKVPGVFSDPKGNILNAAQAGIVRDAWRQGDIRSGDRDGKIDIPILTGGLVFQKIALGLGELDLAVLREVPEARIAGAFMVPLIYSGLTAGQQATTYDNLAGSRQFFYEDTISPMWQRDAATITQRLVGEGTGRYIWHYTKDVIGLRKDLNALSARVVTQWEKGLVTRNEARAALDLSPVDDELDGFYADVQPAPPAPPAPAPTEPPPETPQEPAGDPGESQDGEEPKTLPQGTHGRKDDDLEAKAVEYFKAYDTPAEEATEKIAGKLAGEFGKLLKVVLGKLPAKAYTKDDERLDPFDTPEWEAAFAKATTPDIRALILEQMARAVADAGENWEAISSTFDEAVDRALDGSIDLIKTSVGTVKEELRDLLKQNRTLPVAELRDLITRRFEEVYTKSRAQVIARTTSTYATGASQLEAWKELDTEYVWLTQRDGSVRDTHQAADGKRPGEDGKFTVGSATGPHPGAMSTAEESVNCRCVLRARPKK